LLAELFRFFTLQYAKLLTSYGELVSYFSESITGITYIKNDRRVSQFLRNPDVKHSYESLEMHEEIAEPTARLVAEGKLETTFFERDTNKKTK
jgi:hypothetical protein